MKLVATLLPNKGPIKVVPLADLHIGSPKCDLDRIQEVIADIADDPDCFVILGGDLINNATKSSVSDTYNETMSPMEQAKLVVDILKPIKDKVLAVVTGNHEARSLKGDGLDIMWFVCVELGIESKYDPDGVVSLVRFGKTLDPTKGNKSCYSIYVTHGDKIGGGTTGGKMNGLEKRGLIVNADVIITGHTHSPATFKTASFIIDEHNDKILTKEQTFVNTGAWLNWEGYAERCGYKPSSTAMPTITLYPKRTSKDSKYVQVHL